MPVTSFPLSPCPLTLLLVVSTDARTVQAVNAVGAYNVLFTAARLGIRRIVQASSVNAPGLGYGADKARARGRRWERLPLTEEAVAEPDDAYGEPPCEHN